MELTGKQNTGFDMIMAFRKDKNAKRFALDGPAGTGKSTIAARVAEEIGEDDVLSCALTGKAANVLREKGSLNASTIHSALYTKIGDKEDEPRFVLNRNGPMSDAKLVIIDEYSMLSQELVADIERVAKKVLYLGDPFQLPPIHGECPITADFTLDEVHRQALDSPILRAATDVREGRKLEYCKDGEFIFGTRRDFTVEDYETADQIIVGKNDTRIKWNDRFRQKLGFEGQKYPCRGDKLICTKNNHELGLFNGMIGECMADVRKVSFQELSLDFEEFKSLKVWDGNFEKRKDPPAGINKKFDRFDFGYAITCHKSQGSEFGTVLVYNEPIGREQLDRQRWLYTAITRAKEKCMLVQP